MASRGQSRYLFHILGVNLSHKKNFERFSSFDDVQEPSKQVSRFYEPHRLLKIGRRRTRFRGQSVAGPMQVRLRDKANKSVSIKKKTAIIL